jgi:S-formylglutathione hydrolase FrmB
LALGLLLACARPGAAVHHHNGMAGINNRLLGQLVDHTGNHGCDRRLWSAALGQWRDLYVYLPPGFDAQQRYPILLWLHGLSGDERQLPEVALTDIDQAIAAGKLPPLIIAMPDGQSRGHPGITSTHSSFLNTRLGRFEDYLFGDVWNFVLTNYPVRPERQAHVIGGVSLGGGAAYHHAIKHRHLFSAVVGIFPPVNVRWLDCHGRYFGNFDPCCWGWRTNVRWGHEPVGKFYGIIKVPLRSLVYPLYGRGPNAVVQLSRDNPIEMLDYYQVMPGDLSMFIAYGALDEFNLDAQAESFIFRASQLGLPITVCRDPQGRHNSETARKFIGPTIAWLAPQIAPFSPPVVVEWHK